MLKQKRGIVLLQVMIVVMLLAILSSTLIFVSYTEIKRGKQSADSSQAYYNARSGVMIARGIYKNYKGDLKKLPYYFYGRCKGSEFTINGPFQGTYSGNKQQLYNGGIFTTVRQDTSTGKIVITSTGYSNNTGKTVEYVFEPAGTPSIPSVSSGSALDAASTPAVFTSPAGGNLLNSSGYIVNSSYLTYSQTNMTLPVLFQSKNVPTAYNGTAIISASALYFINNNTSFRVESAYVNLKTNFVSFSGSLIANNCSLILNTNGSTLGWSDISSDDPGKKDASSYGVIYIGTDINGRTPNNMGPGFYYFPDGVLLPYNMDYLIKISDASSINFQKLGYFIDTGGDASGIYKQ